MNDRLASYQDIFLELYREFILPVYRFHLVRSGDWHQAQATTGATFLEALRWFDPALRGSREEKVWLFGIAAGMQMRRVRDGHSYTSEDVSIVPSQEQMAQFVKVSEVSENWRRLPRKQADAQAFALFAGLELNEVAEIIGWDIADVMEKIAGEVSEHNDLRILANAIEPVGFFTRWLENEIREMGAQRNGPDRLRLELIILRATYRMGPFFTFLSRVLPVIVFIGLLLWGIWAVTHQDLQGNQPEIKDTAPVRSTFTPNVLRFPPSHDTLVLADQEGRIYTQSLANDEKVYLSKAGFYQPNLMDPLNPPTISPDGKWFSIAWVGNLGTWLLSLDGKEAIKVIDRPVRLAWSPGGSEVVFGDPANPSWMLSYRINNHVAQPVATAMGTISSLAWSPDGEKIGVVSYSTRTATDQQLGGDRQYIQLNIGIYDLAAREFRIIKSYDDSPIDPHSTEVNLMWTNDGKELWLPAFRMSFSLADYSEHELVSQPFLDNYGLQSALLGKAASGWQNQALLAPDRKYLAVVNNMANGTPGTVFVHPIDELYQREWVDSFPGLKSYGELAWTDEGKNLIFSEKVDGPGKVLRINASTGQWQQIAQYAQFFGTRSSLISAGSNLAPEVDLVRSSQANSGVTHWTDISDPVTGLHLRLPENWRTWSYSYNQNSALALANFDFANPWGFASLYDQDVMLWITSTPRQNDGSIRMQLEAIARGYEPGVFSFEPLSIDGAEAYLTTSESPDRATYQEAWIATRTNEFRISTSPANHKWDTLIRQIIYTFRFDEAVRLPSDGLPTPTPEGKALSKPPEWRDFQSLQLKLTFKAPAAYMQSSDRVCSVYDDGGTIHLGSRIWVTMDDPKGKTLEEYVSSVTFNNTSQWNLVTQESSEVGGEPAITKTYLYWGEKVKKATFVLHNGKVFALNYSSEGTCDFPDQGIDEEKAYQHMIDTLHFTH
jgi:DNA-directed RNA polymerase specialized sigma24 family protein